MGGGIAMNFAQRRHPGDDPRDEAGGARHAALGDHPQELRGARSRRASSRRTSSTSAWACSADTLAYDDLTDADLVIEAVFEDMAVKEEVFTQARRGREARRDPRHQHLDARRRQDRRVHEAPAGRDRHALLQPGERDEAARGRARREDRARTCSPPSWSSARRSGRPPVVSGVCDGFIGNRMLEQYVAPGRLPARGGRARRSRSTRRCEKFGMAMGPFRMGDLAGNDIGWDDPQAPLRRAARLRATRRSPTSSASSAASARRPARAGTTTSPGKRDADPRPGGRRADRRSTAQELGITPRKISDEEIVERLVYALVNEGAKILEEGIALRASDIDMVYLTGYGFPPLPRRADVLRRHGRACTTSSQSMQRFAAIRTTTRRLEAGAAARASWPPKASRSTAIAEEPP